MTRISVPVATLALGAAFSLHAQSMTVMPATRADTAVEVQRPPSEKSPALAAILSWFVYPGIGSYYAGAPSHGTRHVVIATAALGGVIALLATCDSDGFCDFDHDAARLTLAVALGGAYVGNLAWSIVAAISDAEDYNYRLRAGPLHFTPAVVALSSPGVAPPRVGMTLVSLRF